MDKIDTIPTTALITYVYPSAINYLPDFIKTVKTQTSSAFDVILFNDGVENLNEYDFPFRKSIIKVAGSVVEIRFRSFEILKELNYDKYIFLDLDDTMTSNRVEVLSHLLETEHIVCNDLNIMSDDTHIITKQIWLNRLGEQSTFDYKFIEKKNIIGLGNVGFRKSILFTDLVMNTLPIAADWFLFYQILRNGQFECLFTSKCQTNYRQHEDNLAGIKHLSDERIAHVLNVVKCHYEALIAVGYQEFEEELIKLSDSKIQKNKFNIIENPFWWEEIENCI